jgi:protein-S-isoprenylcysteine O-methyltransferase Ste14
MIGSSLVALIGFFAAMAGLLFGSAGRWDLPMFWLYLVATLIISGVALVLMYRRSPDLIQERLRPGPGERDRLSVRVLVLAMMLHWAVAGLDVGRFRWSGHVPVVAQLVGLLGYVVGLGVMVWAILANRFFSSAVRIQADRGHYVITSGPYRIVRHPGYAGAVLFFLCSGIALGSWWSVLPMVVAAARLIYRTSLEDRMLQRELAGYRDYARMVRYRLVPGVW